MPQLGVISIVPDSGKSTLLEIVSTMAYRGRRTASPTLATIFRVIDRDKATYTLPALHNLDPARNLDLRTVLNACHRRAEAKVERTIERNGDFVPVTYDCWAALAWGSIGAMPAEITSRAITLPMRPATEDEAAKLLNASPSRDRTFGDTRRHFAAWAATVQTLPVVDLPKGVINRSADNWRVLFQVAAKAGGGEWPGRVREAYEFFASNEDRPPSREARILTSIRDAFNEESDPADGGDKFIATPALIDTLLKDEEAGWATANHRRAIDAYWLRENLRDLLKPPGSQEKQVPASSGGRDHQRGYFAYQFEDAFNRYPRVPGASGTSGTTGTGAESAKDLAASSVPDHPTASGTASGTKYSSQTAAVETHVPDEPDVPHVPDGKGGKAGEGETAAPKRTPSRQRRKGNGRDFELPHTRQKAPALTDAQIAAAIRELKLQYPTRSVDWVAKTLGQPKSLVREVLGNGEAQ